MKRNRFLSAFLAVALALSLNSFAFAHVTDNDLDNDEKVDFLYDGWYRSNSYFSSGTYAGGEIVVMSAYSLGVCQHSCR